MIRCDDETPDASCACGCGRTREAHAPGGPAGSEEARLDGVSKRI